MTGRNHRSSASRPAATLLWAGVLGACRGTEVASVNLDALLDADNQLRYVAKVETGFRYFVHQFLDEDWFGDEGILGAAQLEPIPDPAGVALGNLLDLRKGAAFVGDAWVQAEQVRQYARYGVHCPSVLARERSLLELGRHAQRLGLSAPEVEPEVAANAAEIRLALEGLVEVLERAVRENGRVDATWKEDLESSCAVLSGLELDVEGGWRLLKVVARFGLVTRLPAAELEPILRLSRDVQERLVGQALAAGRKDPHPLARAAAVRASAQAYGEPFLREALLVLSRPGQISPLFGLRAPEPEEEEVLVALFDAVRERGLPLPSGVGEAERRTTRLAMLHGLVQAAHDYTAFGDRARTAAMLALGKVAGARIDSLREEDWASWFREYEARERAALEAAPATTPGGGSGGT